MPITVECDTPGLEACFVAVSERWTRGDLVTLFQPGGPAVLFPRKVTACSLALVNSDEPLTDPAQVYGEDGEPHPDLDLRLGNFMANALVLAVNEVASLGKANARLSSGGTERARTTMPPAQTMGSPTTEV
jgi:hypothetical protein